MTDSRSERGRRRRDRVSGREFSPCADGMESTFFILAILGFYIVGVGASTTRMVGELTHMRSMCVGVAETGVEHRSPAKNHKETFLIMFFSLVRKERKGQKEESFPLLTPSVASRRPVRTKCPDRPAIAEPRLQVRNAQAPTRIYCCAMSGYGEPRGN